MLKRQHDYFGFFSIKILKKMTTTNIRFIFLWLCFMAITLEAI